MLPSKVFDSCLLSSKRLGRKQIGRLAAKLPSDGHDVLAAVALPPLPEDGFA